MKENHSDCFRVAQHALVLGSSHIPLCLAQLAQSSDLAIQSDSAQESVQNLNIHAWLKKNLQTPDRLVQGVSTRHPALSQSTSWQKRVQTMWPQWSFWPRPQF